MANVRKKLDLEKTDFVIEDLGSYIYHDSFLILLRIHSVLCDSIL